MKKMKMFLILCGIFTTTFATAQFPSVVTEPVNSFAEADSLIEMSPNKYYCGDYQISKKTPLDTGASGAKRIYFIPISEPIEKGKENEWLAQFGKRLVGKYAPNYLLGAMTHIPNFRDVYKPSVESQYIIAVGGKIFHGGNGGDGCLVFQDAHKCSEHYRRPTVDEYSSKTHWLQGTGNYSQNYLIAEDIEIP